jgi:hypothetical protein
MSTTFYTEYASPSQGSGPSHIHDGANSRDFNGSPTQEGSEGPGDEKDEEIACLKCAYHDAVMENSGKKGLYKDQYVGLCFSEKFYNRFILNSLTVCTSLKTLGHRIPKIMSLFESVNLLVANADEHEIFQSGGLPD